MTELATSLKHLWFVVALAAMGLPGIAQALQPGVGWTLAGNGRDVAIDVPTVFGTRSVPVTGVSDRVLSVWKWDAINQQWAFFTPSMDLSEITTYAAGKGYSVLKTIFPAEGYWINTSAATTLNTPAGQIFTHSAWQLANGWNLFATGTNTGPPQFNTSIAPFTATTIWAWNAAQQNWYFYAPSLAASGGLAAYIQQKGYLDFGNVKLADGVGFWVNRAALQTSPTAGLAALDQAKQMFAELRTTYRSFNNVSQTGALDAEVELMKGNLTNGASATSDVFWELTRLSSAVDLYVAAKNRQLGGYTVVAGATGTSVVSDVHNEFAGPNPQLHRVGFRSSICSTTVANVGTSAPSPVSCTVYGSSSAVNYAAATEQFAKFTVTENSTDNYSITAQGWLSTNIFFLSPPSSPVGTAYAGTFVKTKDTNGIAQSLVLASDLPPLTAGYEKYGVSLNANRALQVAGAPNATYRYSMTGSIAAIVQGAPAVTYALDAGSFADHVEDALGRPAGANPVQEFKLVGRAQTANARFDSTVDATSFLLDADGMNSEPTRISFSGSLTDISPGGPGKILNITGTIAASSYGTFHSAQPKSVSNYVQETIKLSGTLQLPSRPLIGITLSLATVGPNSVTFAGQYTDSNGATISLAGTHATAQTTIFPFSTIDSTARTFTNQDSVIVTMTNSGTDGTITKGGTQLGKIVGGTIYYTDGVFESLQ